MKTSLDHLPPVKQREIERAVAILHEEFEEALALATSERKKRGRILRIILFGSYARGDWVDDYASLPGYQSDFDILVIVNDEQFTSVVDYWEKAEQRIMNHPGIRRVVNVIVHSLYDVNDKLAKGHYFFTDIKKEGIELYKMKGARKLAERKDLSPEEAREIAREFYEHRFKYAKGFLKAYGHMLEPDSLNIAAFQLHQAVEHAYHAVLLTLTLYTPKIHNIEKLRSFSESLDKRLIVAWPRYYRRDRNAFDLLRRAYVEARYSPHYEITQEQLQWLAEGTERLHAAVKEVCEERLVKK